MKLIAAFVLFCSVANASETIFLPNAGVGTAMTGTIDSGLAAANVHITGVTGSGFTVSQGNKGSIPQSWYVQPCDGTNCQTFTAGGAANVNASQSGAWSVGRTWSLLNSTDSISSWLMDGSGNSISSTSGSLNANVTNFPATQAVTQSGTWNINNISGSVSLPTGAATSANQTTANTSLASIVTNTTGLATSANQTNKSQQTQITDGTISANIKPLNVQVTGTDNGLIVNSVIHGLTTGGGGGYVDVKVNPSGALAVDGSGVTQPISAASLPLPTGAATSANQTNGNQQTQIVQGGNTATVNSNGSLTVAGVSAVGTAPVNPPIAVSGVDGGGLKRHLLTDTSGRLEIDTAQSLPLPSGASTSALQTTANTSLTTIATNTGKQPINTTGSGSAAAATVSTVITLSHPANAVGFVLQNLDTSTANVRWAIGRTATTTLGQQLQPGRDSGFIPCGADVTLVAESGTQNYDLQWISQ